MAFSRPWAPFREMDEFRRTVDDMLEHLRGKIGYPLGSGSAALKPPIESFVEERKLTVRVELPGIDPKDITLNVVCDMLTIRAPRQEEQETKKRDFLHRELRYGAIERSMSLPQGVKAEDIKASFSNGLL
jgi:HSP20 family protein